MAASVRLGSTTRLVHEVLRSDGTPYRQAEVDLIRQLTGKWIRPSE